MGFGRGEADGGRWEEEMGFFCGWEWWYWLGGEGEGFLLWEGWDIKWG